ncbi:hypothetical protein D9M73_274680 [compost metagenome]
MDGRINSSPNRYWLIFGRKPSKPGDSSTPLPRALATSTRPWRTASSRPGTPRAESVRNSSGSQKSSSSRRMIAWTRRKPLRVFR